MMRDVILSARTGVRSTSRTPAVGAKDATPISSAADLGASVLCDVRSDDARTFANAVAYLRVSTDQQAESGLGLEAQRASVMAAAMRLRLQLREVFVDDGVSGALSIADRPMLMRAVTTLHRGDVFLVAKRDRLGRDVIEVAMIERLIGKRGARTVSAAGEGTENEDPSSLLLRRLIDSFAEYERLIISARTKAALAAKRARGERAGQLPFGFQLAADGKLEPNPIEQDKLARIRDLKATGHSIRKIADVLNADGITTRRGTAYRFQYVAHALRKARAS